MNIKDNYGTKPHIHNDTLKFFFNLFFIVFSLFAIGNSAKIIDTDKAISKGRGNGLFLNDYRDNSNADSQHILLSTKGLYQVNKDIELINEFEKPLNSSYRFIFVSNNSYYECINIGNFRCFFHNTEFTDNDWKSNKKIFIQTIFNYRPITYSLSLLNLLSDEFAAAWYEKSTLNFEIFSKNGTKLSKHFSLPILYLNDKDPFISLDVFPKTNNIIIGYAHNSTNYVKIYSYSKKKIIKTYSSLLSSRSSIYVKVLNDNCFIICLRKGNPSNLCRIIHLNYIENLKEKLIINLPTNVIRITPITNRIFALIWKKINENELRMQLIDNSNGKIITKEHYILVPQDFSSDLKPKIVKFNLLIKENEWLMPIYSIKLKNNEEYFYYEKYSIDLVCYDFSIHTDVHSVSQIEFDKHIAGKNFGQFRTSQRIQFIYTGDTKLGRILVNNTKLKQVEAKMPYYINDTFYFQAFNESSFINARYIVTDVDTYEETNECSIYIIIGDKFKNFEDEISEDIEFNEEEKIKKKEINNYRFNLIIIGSYVVIFLLIISKVVINDFYVENFMKSITDLDFYIGKYYIKQFTKRELILSNNNLFSVWRYFVKVSMLFR